MECPPVFSCLALSSHTVKGKVISVACKVYTTGTPCSSQLYSHLIPLLLSMLLQLCWPPCESPCSIPESWHCCSLCLDALSSDILLSHSLISFLYCSKHCFLSEGFPDHVSHFSPPNPLP